VCGGPNFFFEACADRYDAASCEGLDLSSWRVAFCGAEPVRPSGLARFADRYAPHGFHASALHPCYGLAEATLFVTAGEPRHGIETLPVDGTGLPEGRLAFVAADDPKARLLVSCGWPRPPAGVVIVDPATCRAVADGTIGEIWLTGPHLASGYWHRPAETAQTFEARREGSDEAHCRTGDLGFIRDGRLYVVGRIKDVIVRNGVKYHAEDVEHAVRAADPALETASCAAFGVDDGKQERLVVAIESRRAKNAAAGELEAFGAQVRAQVLASVGIRLDDVLIVAPGVLPRTTSGKVQRRQCRAVLQADVGEPALAAAGGGARP
jgi:acyl-CoA synthetase (AMP-forming)/AMP-acid ligase II